MDFTSRLLSWYKQNKRELPWRESRDPYKIWLSEIIFQQTRIAQGYDYYLRFVDKYPNVQALAAASEDEVLALWQGLGYYSRARNLHQTAKDIVDKYQGQFPADFNKLLSLKGIGQYTAAAIASMAFDLPFAALDGNLTRVLTRYLGIEEPVDDPGVVKQIRSAANELLDKQHPGIFNQALMDFGAMVCKPGKPLCGQCTFSADCIALAGNKVMVIPLKKKKIIVKNRYFHFFLIHSRHSGENLILVQKRLANDIWKNLHQLPLLETIAPGQGFESMKDHPVLEKMLSDLGELPLQGEPVSYTHLLTHQRIEAIFHYLPLPDNYFPHFEMSFQWVTFDQFRSMGKPILIARYLEKMKDKL